MYRRLLAIPLLACLLAGMAHSQVEKDEQKIAKAREALKEARRTLDETREQLEEVYVQLKKEFEKISGPYSIQFIHGLEKAWTMVITDLKARWDLKAEEGRAVTRRRFEEFAYPIMEEAAFEVLALDKRLMRPFLEKGMEVMFDKLRNKKAIEEGDLEVELLDILPQDLKIHTFWNNHLFMHMEEAKAFAKANEDFGAASTELDRLERPELYTSRGKKAPPRMVYIPSGTYSIGANIGLERPRRRITLKAFYMDKYEITNKEYRDFLMKLDPKLYEEYVPYFWPRNINMEHFYPEDRADHPVAGVTWTAAQDFAQSVGKRLPTEEEWEVAARGKQRNEYPWGSEFEPGRCNMAGSGINTTIEVGYFTEGASPFECLDMAGNVWEWTSTNQDGRTVKEASEDENVNMTIRGGDYREKADRIRCDYRWAQPMDPYTGRHPSSKVIGFRCVKDMD
jgi:formylglycine-generating enzyme required for sulfatase activity